MIEIARGPGQPVRLREPVALDDPAERIVLQGPDARGAHDGIVLLLLEHHADKGRLGHRLAQLRATLRIVGGGQRLGSEAGAVVREDALDARERCRLAMGRRVNGEVAALRVAADVDAPLDRPGDAVQILHGANLRRHVRLEGHVEVFFPSDERVVGAAEAHVGVAVRKAQRAGRELLLLLLARLARIGREAHAEQARRGHRGGKKRDEPVRIPKALGHGREPVCPEQLVKRRAARTLRRLGLRRQPVIRKACEHEAVHIRERQLIEPAELPPQVIDYVLLSLGHFGISLKHAAHYCRQVSSSALCLFR